MVPQGVIQDALLVRNRPSVLAELSPCLLIVQPLVVLTLCPKSTVPSALRNESSGGKQYFRSLRCSF